MAGSDKIEGLLCCNLSFHKMTIYMMAVLINTVGLFQWNLKQAIDVKLWNTN